MMKSDRTRQPSMASARRVMLLATAAMIGLSAPAWAQTADPQTSAPERSTDEAASPNSDQVLSEEANAAGDIVVTGTLIRGVAPVGTNVVGLTRSDVLSTGATNSNELLGQVPQVSNTFNATPAANGDIAAPIIRPNIRNLSNGGGQTTLVLLNGHRLPNLGIVQTAPDPASIAVSAIERVEVVPDGGSSIYGSDAIGGVINFITRKRMNGLEINATYGIGDDYWTYDINGAAGKDWGSGGFIVAYEYSRHSNILGRDRDYVSQFRDGGSDFRSNQCSPGTVTAGGVNYALPSRTPGTNLCDTSDFGSIFPRESKHNVFVSLTQDLNDWLKFDIEGFYANRVTRTSLAQSRSTGSINSTNPYFRSIAGETTQSVSFAYDSVFGNERGTRSQIEAFGITPAFTAKLGGDWQLRVQGNVGQGYTNIREQVIDTTAEAAALAGTTTATALNPYDLSQTNPTVLAGIRNYENYADSVQELAEGRAVVDGTLFALPGGAVHAALGAEYHHESFDGLSIGAPIGQGQFTPRTFASRNVKSVFGEIVVPIFGADNGFAGMRRLDVSASARYDSYSDVGNTTNPKFGITWKPIDSLTIRGNYGTSFNAPSLADSTGATDTRAQVFQSSPWVSATAAPGDAQRRTILIAGGNPDLTPQKANTYSIGADFKPAFVPGLTIAATYFNVHFTNQIGLVPFFNPSQIYLPAYTDFVTLNPTLAQAQALLGGFRLDGTPTIEALYANGQSPYVIVDARRNNLGSTDVDGIDFNVAFNRQTGFGAINASIGGTYTLNRTSEPLPGADIIDELASGTSRLSFIGAVGGTVGRLTGRAQVTHSQGYDVDLANQDRIGSYDVIDLYFAYDLGTFGFGKGASLTLNVDNVLDTDPPVANTSAGYANGATLGRVATVGVRTAF